LLAVACAAAGCATGNAAAPPATPLASTTSSSTSTSSTTSTTPLAPTTTTSTLPPIAIPATPYRIGVRTFDWVDNTRPTPANNGYRARSYRELLTTIWYPAIGTPSAYVHHDATADHAAGPFPMVLFAHGHGGTPADYLADIMGWTSRGYVVAAPAFPLSNRRAHGGPSYADLTSQPGDLSYVLTRVLQLSADPGSWMHNLVDARRVGAIGHSEGAWTVLALAGDSCCRDTRVKAAVVLAGEMATGFPKPFYTKGAPPLLFVHARDDDVVPYRNGAAAYDAAPMPKYFLSVATGGHVAPYEASGDPTNNAVLEVVNDFLDRYLKSLAAVKIASPAPKLAALSERLAAV
jgi:predicted dienelactone hydrolase